MLKRILPVFLVVVVAVSLFCVPVSAIGVSSSDDGFRYAALTFDTVEFASDVLQQYCTLPFPFNSAASGIEEFGFGEDNFIAFGSETLIPSGNDYFPSLVGNISFPSLSYDQNKTASFTLIGGQQIVDHNRLSTYAISFNRDNIYVSSARLSVSYFSVSKNEVTSRISASLEQLNINVPIVNGEILLGGALIDNLDLGSEYRYTFIHTIKLDLSFYRKSPDTTAFSFVIPSDGSNYPNSHVLFDNWLSERDFKYNIEIVDPEYFDVSHWLEESIGSILDLEIAPGFTLNSILYIILVLIVFIAFIKLLA